MVDDVVSNAKLLSLILEGMFKARVVITYSAKAAMAKLEDLQPDVMMIDINMPVVTGFQLLDDLRGMPRFKDTPLVAVSANAMRSDIQRGLDAGFDAYIPKPYDFDDVWRTVSPLLGIDPEARAEPTR